MTRRLPSIKALHNQRLKDIRQLTLQSAAVFEEESVTAESKLAEVRLRLAPLHRDVGRAVTEVCKLREMQHTEKSLEFSEVCLLEHGFAEVSEECVFAESRRSDLEEQLRLQLSGFRGEYEASVMEDRRKREFLRERDEELSEVNCQLAEVEVLFGNANQQLQNECARILKLHDAMVSSAQQEEELTSIFRMLNESDTMLARVRDSLESERARRMEAYALLVRELQHTKQPLELLKYCKQQLLDATFER